MKPSLRSFRLVRAVSTFALAFALSGGVTLAHAGWFDSVENFFGISTEDYSAYKFKNYGTTEDVGKAEDNVDAAENDLDKLKKIYDQKHKGLDDHDLAQLNSDIATAKQRITTEKNMVAQAKAYQAQQALIAQQAAQTAALQAQTAALQARVTALAATVANGTGTTTTGMATGSDQGSVTLDPSSTDSTGAYVLDKRTGKVSRTGEQRLTAKIGSQRTSTARPANHQLAFGAKVSLATSKVATESAATRAPAATAKAAPAASAPHRSVSAKL